MKYGIDISHWNGDIDFNKLDKDFVIMKVSQGSHKDAKFDEYYSKCNLPKGAYIYNKVYSIAEAKVEANYAVQFLKGKTLEYGVWLDMEDISMKKLGKDRLTEIINAEAQILKSAGFNVGIYCNKDWYTNILDGNILSTIYPFWIARYPSSDNGTIKESLNPKSLNGCKMWQYSSKGKVNGINGCVDLNIEYESPFNTKSINIDEIAIDVINGKYGSGDARKKNLGNLYSIVQKRVNEILKG